MIRRMNLALLAALVVTMAAALVLRPDPTVPNIEILPDMAHSPAYASFAPNPVLPGGSTLQVPVPGTLPRGFERPRYSGTPEDAARAAVELTNPVPIEVAQERGAIVYRNFCTPCHGPTLRGDGTVALRGYPAPPNLKGEKSMQLSEGQMFHIVSFGQKNMPSHASQLSVDDRWSVVSYVWRIQRGGQPPATAEVKQ